MNSGELLNILQNDQDTTVMNPAVKPLNHFLEDSLERPTMTIVNLDPCDEPGSHWVAVHVPLYGHTEYFDSYGKKPDKNFLLKLQKINGKVLLSNCSVQGISTVCGQYCLLFLLLRSRNYTFHDIVTSFLLCESSAERDIIVNDIINSLFKSVLNRRLRVVDEVFINKINQH